MSEKCPKCGVIGKTLDTDRMMIYACGSYYDSEMRFHQFAPCLEHQLAAAQSALAQRDAAIKRKDEALEAALAALESTKRRYYLSEDDTETVQDKVRAALAGKE